MTLRTERVLVQARDAWNVGRLDVALRGFEAARREAPRAVEVLYPLARALAEHGDQDQALAILAEAAALQPGTNVVPLIAATTLYDSGDLAGARERLVEVGDGNVVAAALTALVDLEEKGDRVLRLCRSAPWIAESGGRLLAALARLAIERDAEAAEAFLRGLFRVEADEAPPPPASPKAAVASSKSWQGALEHAFYTGEFQQFLTWWHRDVPDDWRDETVRVCHAYVLATTGSAAASIEAAATLLGENPANHWTHFTLGVARSRSGERRGAHSSFVRAMRISDYDLHPFLSRFLEHCGVEIVFID